MDGTSLRVAQIDVLIPAYNAETTIEAAVASIQSQTIRDIRIIIVNDGSTDRTHDILNKIAEADERVHVLTTSNGGIVSALNAGLEICNAEFVARHDADDWAYPNRFEAQLNFLQNEKDCVAVGSNIRHIDQYGKLIGTQSRLYGDVRPDPDWFPSKEPYLMHPFLMVRLDAIRKVGGYRYVVHAEDTDLYWRLLGVGRLHNLRDIHGEYRIHSGSISSASIVNGRVAAVASQLAAISYKRRLQGLPDIDFSPELRTDYERAKTLGNILELVGQSLSPDELSYLKAAASAKLLSLMEYRPYLPDHQDCALIGEALGQTAFSTQNMREISRLKGKIALRLLKLGRLSDAFALQPSLENIARAVVSNLKKSLFKRKRSTALTN